jgi:hypothetical protein
VEEEEERAGIWFATPRNGMLLTVSYKLPTPSVGMPFNERVSVVRLMAIEFLLDGIRTGGPPIGVELGCTSLNGATASCK